MTWPFPEKLIPVGRKSAPPTTPDAEEAPF